MPAEHIREEIRAGGAISFARFMERALYCPETGYYERNQDNVGRRGDFITSVSAGSLFGELLAFQFAEWLEAAGGRMIVEAGAHDGKLARDILNWLQLHRPKLFSEIEYGLIEPSAVRQAWQKETLRAFTNVRWHSSLPDLKLKKPGSPAVVFSNELLDAFPVHRFGWDANKKGWYEWGVTLAGQTFQWARCAGEPSLPASIRRLPPALQEVLPDGYIIETSPAAEEWWREAAAFLTRGKLVAIDYGFTDEEMISPARVSGTLRAYHRHRVTNDLLANPGEQDLTAHVNFSAIQLCGEAAGLKTETFGTQPQFLTRILTQAVKEQGFAALDARQIRQFQALTHPEHPGRAFRVLVQAK